MKRAIIKHALFCAFAALALKCSTSISPVAGGTSTGSETTNGVTASIMRADSTPVANARVHIRLADYVASLGKDSAKTYDSRFDLVTDSDGRFFIDDIEPGRYTIEVSDNLSQAVVLSCNVSSDTDTFNLGAHFVREFVTVSGTVAPDSLAGNVVASIYGLERSVVVDASTGAFTFTNLAPGAYTIRLSAASKDYGAAIIETPELTAGASHAFPEISLVRFDREDYSQWSHSKAVLINTASTGASISENVYRFPLLVLLDSVQFDFSAALPDGRDIRFSKSGGTRLNYEIEQWSSGRAAVWVLVDTVFGNSASPQITMHWGNTGAPDFSSARQVFDTASGFEGVWHLSRPAPYRDATLNSNSGINNGTINADGRIGAARYFDGIAYASVEHNTSLEPSGLSLSCWFKTDGVQVPISKLINKGEAGIPYQSYTLEIRKEGTAGFQTARQDSTADLLQSSLQVDDDAWHFLAATFDAATGKSLLYLDGDIVDSSVNLLPIQYYSAQPYPLMFGRQWQESHQGRQATRFKGWLDEPRLSSTVRTDAWFKLCWENQRSGSTLVTMQ